MADISKIRDLKNERTYNIADAQARSDLNTKLSLSGGTLEGRLIANGKISLSTDGGNAISQKDTDKASIKITTEAVSNTSRYDSIIGGKFTDGSSWNMGVMNNSVYFVRYSADQTANGFTGSVIVDLINSCVSKANTLTNFTINKSTGQDANTINYAAHTYYSSNGPSTSIGASTNNGALYSQAYNDSWVAQIAQDYRTGNLFTRGMNNGTWQAWKAVSYNGHTHNYLPLSGGEITGGNLGINGYNLNLKTLGSSSDASVDIIWFYGNNQEKMRLWTDNEYTTKIGPHLRIYKKDGTQLFNGYLSLSDHTHPDTTIERSVTQTSAPYTYRGLIFRRTGNVVQVYINGLINLPEGGYHELCSIPSEFIPSANTLPSDFYANANKFRFYISNDGKLYIYNYTTAVFSDLNLNPLITFVYK